MLTGIVIGIMVIAVCYPLLHYLNVYISSEFFNRRPIFRESTIQVISIFLNVLPFRYIMLKTNNEYTGRGILLVTFIVGMAYFFYYVKF
jgi:hypothetical protein